MTASGAEFSGVTLHSGTAVGTLLVLEAPLSFWGGSELASGRIVDERHPQLGQSMAGRVLAMHSGRGSSSSSSVLAEQIRSGVSPSAIVLSEVDAIIVLGTIVAAELYDKHIPVIMVARAVIDSLTNDLLVEVVASAGGAAGLRVLESPEPAPSCGAPQEQEETTR